MGERLATFEALTEASSVGLMADRALLHIGHGEQGLARKLLADFLAGAAQATTPSSLVTHDAMREQRARWWVDQALERCPGLLLSDVVDNAVNEQFLVALSEVAAEEHILIMDRRTH